MAQKNATPSREQARIICKQGLDRLLWTVVKDLPHSMIIRNRFTGEFKVIEK